MLQRRLENLVVQERTAEATAAAEALVSAHQPRPMKHAISEESLVFTGAPEAHGEDTPETTSRVLQVFAQNRSLQNFNYKNQSFFAKLRNSEKGVASPPGRRCRICATVSCRRRRGRPTAAPAPPARPRSAARVPHPPTSPQTICPAPPAPGRRSYPRFTPFFTEKPASPGRCARARAAARPRARGPWASRPRCSPPRR